MSQQSSDFDFASVLRDGDHVIWLQEIDSDQVWKGAGTGFSNRQNATNARRYASLDAGDRQIEAQITRLEKGRLADAEAVKMVRLGGNLFHFFGLTDALASTEANQAGDGTIIALMPGHNRAVLTKAVASMAMGDFCWSSRR